MTDWSLAAAAVQSLHAALEGGCKCIDRAQRAEREGRGCWWPGVVAMVFRLTSLASSDDVEQTPLLLLIWCCYHDEGVQFGLGCSPSVEFGVLQEGIAHAEAKRVGSEVLSPLTGLAWPAVPRRYHPTAFVHIV